MLDTSLFLCIYFHVWMLNLTDNWCDPTSLNITAKHNTFNTWDSAFVLIQVFHWKNIKIRLHPPPPGVQFSLPVPTNPGQNSSCWRYSWGSSRTVMFRMFIDILVPLCFSLPRSGNHSPHNSPSPCSMSIWSPRWETSARNSESSFLNQTNIEQYLIFL